jgi:hypothetical protein
MSHLRARRARRIRHRLDAGRENRAVLYTVFTVPEGLRQAAADPARWTRWRRAIWKWMKENAGALYGAERTDPAGQCDQARATGEYCDCAKCSKWHPHLNFLWVQRPGFRAFIAPEQLEEMKRAWKKILGEKHFRDVCGEETAVSVHHAYSGPWKGEEFGRQVDHWCSYLGRTWPHWIKSVKKHITLRWLGKFPKIDHYPASVCEDCGEGYRGLEVRTKAEAERMLALGPAACAQACWLEKRRRRKEKMGGPLFAWGKE